MDQVAQAQETGENQGAPVETRLETRPSDRGERGYSRDRNDGRPESFEQMLRRFKKGVDNAGILKEVRARSFFESKSQKARRKEAKAARRRTRNKSRTGE